MSSILEYNPNKHIKLEELENLSISPNLYKDVPIHQLNGSKYADRLELGRTIYKNLNAKGSVKDGLTIDRYFTDGQSDPFTSVGDYEQRHISIDAKDGKVIFSMDCEFPKNWNEISGQIAASKYFFKPHKQEWGEKIENVTGKAFEYSPIHLFKRVSKFFAESGQRYGYFQTEADKKVFEDELNYLQINQMFAFNSPVYFNAGLYESYGIKGSPGINFVRDPETGEVSRIEDGCYIRPQTHACFIKGPEDNLESIVDHVKTEAGIFANGSGIGHNLQLRAEGEPLSSGGKSSGPMSFFALYDAVAGTIKSGGKTRRAARMTTMRQHHPDIMKFIEAKPREDYKAMILMKAGIEPGFEGEAYTTVKFQNTNLSVRLNNQFFEQVANNGDIELRYIKSGMIAGKISADKMLKKIAFGSWRIGDPAVQYEDEIQKMNTCKNSGMINSTNPCSEYSFLDDTSCNLGSLNLLKFADSNGKVDVESYKQAIRIATIALDIANEAASYPDQVIAKTSPEFRTIGLGYANLGSLIMRRGLAYDSEEGRSLAAVLAAILTGESYVTSSEMAKKLSSFTHYELNKDSMMEVMTLHKRELDKLNSNNLEDRVLQESAKDIWNKVLEQGKLNGFRNAQASVLAPTGTIGYLMGCDTFGVEPATALIITKHLAGGGDLNLVIEEIPNALRNLDYTAHQIKDISDYITKNNVIAGAPHLNPSHYSVFDTAFSPQVNGRTIPFEAHVKMLGATQPFISGAISKTNNLPETATVKDIYDGYILGHQLGLKALSVFRFNSKPVSVLNFGENPFKELKRGEKRELPQQRNEYKVEVKIGNTNHHISAGEYEDGTVGEIFISAYKEGSSMKGLLNSLSVSISDSLKRGIDLEEVIRKHVGQEFEPKGLTDHSSIRIAKSVVDFAMRWLAVEYLGKLEYTDNPDVVNLQNLRGIRNGATRIYSRNKINNWDYDNVINDPELGGFIIKSDNEEQQVISNLANNNSIKKNTQGIVCKTCGNMMDILKAGCYSCPNCQTSTGSCGG